MDIMQLILGIGFLAAGRRIFWLFVGGVGFVYGFQASSALFPAQPDWVAVAVACAAGIAGALVSLSLQWLAVCVAGFLSGGYVALAFYGGGVLSGASAPAFIIGGVIGLVVLLIFFDWALIVLSSLVGAALVTDNLSISQQAFYVLFALLAVAGIILQSSLSGGRKKQKEKGS